VRSTLWAIAVASSKLASKAVGSKRYGTEIGRAERSSDQTQVQQGDRPAPTGGDHLHQVVPTAKHDPRH
jgi:hypothetical protein